MEVQITTVSSLKRAFWTRPRSIETVTSDPQVSTGPSAAYFNQSRDTKREAYLQRSHFCTEFSVRLLESVNTIDTRPASFTIKSSINICGCHIAAKRCIQKDVFTVGVTLESCIARIILICAIQVDVPILRLKRTGWPSGAASSACGHFTLHQEFWCSRALSRARRPK